MIGYILTLEQKNAIQGQEFASYQYFNCVISIDDIWFTFFTSEEEILIKNTVYNWVLNCPKGEFIPKPTPPII